MIGQGFYPASNASTDGRDGARPSGELVPHLAQQRDEPLVKCHDVAAELLALRGKYAVDEVERAATVEPERSRRNVPAPTRDLVKQDSEALRDARPRRRHVTSSSRIPRLSAMRDLGTW